jgi:hypothetical protein
MNLKGLEECHSGLTYTITPTPYYSKDSEISLQY